MSVFNDFARNVSRFAKATTLGVMAIVATSCGDDKPAPQEPETLTYNVEQVFFSARGGRPGAPDVGIPDEKGKLTGVTVYTTDKKSFTVNTLSSGSYKLTLNPVNGKEISFEKVENPNVNTQNSYVMYDAESIVITGKEFNARFNMPNATPFKSLASEIYTDHAINDAKAGVVVSKPN